MSGDYSIDVNHKIDVSRYHLDRGTKLSLSQSDNSNRNKEVA